MVWDDGVVFASGGYPKQETIALEIATGKVLWETPGRDATSASLIQADNAILATSVEGDLLVLRKNKEKYDLARKYKVAESAVWAHTAFAGGEFYVKDETHLRKYRGL